MSGGLERVNFNLIRYANCWEDARMLLRALGDAPASRIAIIASAGDNALALLSKAPDELLAFDISLPQLYLTTLRQVAIDRLEYDEVLLFLGVRGNDPGLRKQLYSKIRPHLSAGAAAYWNARQAVIGDGVIHCGRFERYFRTFRRYGLPLVHRKRTVQELLLPKSADEQARFYNQHWNNPRWQALMAVFFSKAMMGSRGRHPVFLRQAEVPVSAYIRAKAAAHLRAESCTRNYLLHYIFTGTFGEVLPPYLQPELFPRIKTNIGRMTIRQADADAVVGHSAHDTYCLSNIFEYVSADDFINTAARWSEQLPVEARLLFWNLMATRSFSKVLPAAYRQLSTPYAEDDAGFFYAAFLHEQKI